MLALHRPVVRVDATAPTTDDLPTVVTRLSGEHDVPAALARLAEAIVVPAPRTAAMRDRVVARATTPGRRP